MINSALIVHTKEEVASFFKGVLEKEEYLVFCEKEGVGALKRFLENKPQLVFLGDSIPEISCDKLLDILKSNKPSSMISLITESASVDKATYKKFDEVFKLPVDIETIRQTLPSLLSEYRKRKKKITGFKKLHETEAFLVHLLEHIKVAIVSIDYSGKILSFNRKAQKLWGFQSNFIIGRAFDTLCISENRNKCAPSLIEETVRDGSYKGVLYFERADGTRFPGYLQASIIKGEENDEGIVVVVRDLTKQKELEDRLLEKEKLATLGMVVEGVAHEVRNPLISIGGFARRILRKVDDDFPYKNYLKVIVDDVSRLEAMVKDIESYVHFTKLHKPNFKKGRIEKVLETAIDLIDEKKMKNINLRSEFDPTVQPLYLDLGYLVEVFFNLIENAVESMKSGGTLTLKTLRNDNTSCIIKVIDTGIGIPEDKMDDIFNLFYTTKMSGVGLGLAKARIIIDEHSGIIDVESVRGSGTTVTVMLPLERRQKARR